MARVYIDEFRSYDVLPGEGHFTVNHGERGYSIAMGAHKQGGGGVLSAKGMHVQRRKQGEALPLHQPLRVPPEP